MSGGLINVGLANVRWANVRWANVRWANVRWANVRAPLYPVSEVILPERAANSPTVFGC